MDASPSQQSFSSKKESWIGTRVVVLASTKSSSSSSSLTSRENPNSLDDDDHYNRPREGLLIVQGMKNDGDNNDCNTGNAAKNIDVIKQINSYQDHVKSNSNSINNVKSAIGPSSTEQQSQQQTQLQKLSCLRLFICCSTISSSTVCVYSGTIPISKVKIGATDRSQLFAYLVQDGIHHPTIETSYHYESTTTNMQKEQTKASKTNIQQGSNSNSNSNSNKPFPPSTCTTINRGSRIRISIKQRLVSSGLTKIAYTGFLELEEPKPNASSTTTSSSTATSPLPIPPVLNVLYTLGDAINTTTRQLAECQEQLQTAHASTSLWKDTATKLDVQTWQNEKDQLLQNFVLYTNQWKGKFQEQIKSLQDQIHVFKRQQEMTQTKSRARRNLTESLLLEAPDDLEYEQEQAAMEGAKRESERDPTNREEQDAIPIDDTTALATGRVIDLAASKHSTSSRKPIIHPSEMISATTLKAQAKAYKERKQMKGENKESKSKQTVANQRKRNRRIDQSSEEEMKRYKSNRSNQSSSSKPSSQDLSNHEHNIQTDDDDGGGGGGDSDDNSFDEAMRKAIRAKIASQKRNNEDDSD